MALSMLGWLVVGLCAGILARRLFPNEFMADRASLAILGALGAWAGGALAYLCHFGLSPENPGHWILAAAGAVVLLTLRFLGVQPRAIY